jgi:hypothetical protein
LDTTQQRGGKPRKNNIAARGYNTTVLGCRNIKKSSAVQFCNPLKRMRVAKEGNMGKSILCLWRRMRQRLGEWTKAITGATERATKKEIISPLPEGND